MGFFFLYGLKEVATPSISRCNISLRNLFPHYKMYLSFSLVPPLIKESSLSITLQLLLILHETHSIAGSSGLMYATSSKFIPYDVANVKFKFSSFLFSLSIWYHVYKKWKLKGFKKTNHFKKCVESSWARSETVKYYRVQWDITCCIHDGDGSLTSDDRF